MCNYKIENLSEKHIDGVAEIERVCFAHPWSRADLRAQLDIPASRFLVALDGEKAVGYMGLQISSNEGYVTNIAVLPEYRGQGIASALISRQMENKMDFITLEVRESNAPAIRLYRRFGFENVGVRPRFYTDPIENAVIMTKYFEN